MMAGELLVTGAPKIQRFASDTPDKRPENNITGRNPALPEADGRRATTNSSASPAFQVASGAPRGPEGRQ